MTVLMPVMVFAVVGFPGPTGDGLQNSGVTGGQSASGIGGTLSGGPGAEAKAVQGSISGDLANIVGTGVAAQRGESTVPFRLVFSTPAPARDDFQSCGALWMQGASPVLRPLGVRPKADINAVGSSVERDPRNALGRGVATQRGQASFPRDRAGVHLPFTVDSSMSRRYRADDELSGHHRRCPTTGLTLLVRKVPQPLTASALHIGSPIRACVR